MSLETRFECYKVKHNLDDEAMKELLSLFNDSFIELAHKLLENSPKPIKDKTIEAKPVSHGVKKWATKIAAEYAEENNLTLDNFEKDKITKKDISEYLKQNNSSKSVSTKLKTAARVEPVTKEWFNSDKNDTQKNCHGKCKGMTKSGDPCDKMATTNPDMAKNFYCFKHAMDWKNFEVSSDSSDSSDS